MKAAFLILSFFILFSCGPSKEEQARLAEQAKATQDSLVRAVQLATKLRIERRIMLEDSISSTLALLEGLRNRVIIINADLDAARDKLQVIKQPQFLRTPAERENQIRNQNIRIANLEHEVTAIQVEMQKSTALVEGWQRALKALGDQSN